MLVAVPLAGNLGIAWLLIEATTAASVLLVGFSGRATALEAGWKYLVLTSLGLGVALLGIVLISPSVEGGLGGLSWSSLGSIDEGSDRLSTASSSCSRASPPRSDGRPSTTGFPTRTPRRRRRCRRSCPLRSFPPCSSLPGAQTVALAPAVGEDTARSLLVGFGLLSLAVAVPFLWRALTWKRLLAYSSLEHMGVLALGLAFATPLAIAGVIIHLVGHAVAKALGFYAATPLLAHAPSAAGRAASGTGRTSPALGVSLGISLGTLAGLPPSPLFASEDLIVAGGFSAGLPWEATAAAVLLALGFLGLGHTLLDVLVGKARKRDAESPIGLRGVVALTAVATLILLALTAVAPWLPGSEIVDALVGETT